VSVSEFALFTHLMQSSNGSGFAAIDVGGFNATLIQAADGVFVSYYSPLLQLNDVLIYM
jgi:hypothetical protein